MCSVDVDIFGFLFLFLNYQVVTSKSWKTIYSKLPSFRNLFFLLLTWSSYMLSAIASLFYSNTNSSSLKSNSNSQMNIPSTDYSTNRIPIECFNCCHCFLFPYLVIGCSFLLNFFQIDSLTQRVITCERNASIFCHSILLNAQRQHNSSYFWLKNW